jgi:DNA-binding response OmpR family regulator
VILDDETVSLTRMQYRVLALLVEQAGEVVPGATILKRLWSYPSETNKSTLASHLCGLRRKLGVYADRYIETVHGVGYRFRPDLPRP